MKILFTLLLFICSTANAQRPPVTWNASCASGVQSLFGAGACLSAAGSGVTSFNTRTGSVTLSGADVTTALGFTPENVANKATDLSSNDNSHYPTTAAVKAAIAAVPTPSPIPTPPVTSVNTQTGAVVIATPTPANATGVAYTPTTSGDWSAWTSVPTLVQGALDSLANWIKNVSTKLNALISARILFVASDIGSDSNNCGLFSMCATNSRAATVATSVLTQPAAFSSPVIIITFPAVITPYTENLSITQQGMYFYCIGSFFSKPACQIIGHLVVNLSGTAGGGGYSSTAGNNALTIHGYSFQPTDNSVALQFSGSTAQSLYSNGNYFSTASGTGSALSMTNSGTGSVLNSYYTSFVSNDSGSNTVSVAAGTLAAYGDFSSTIANASTGGSFSDTGGNVVMNGYQLTGAVTLNASGKTLQLTNDYVSSGSVIAITNSAGTLILDGVLLNSSNTTTVSVASGAFISKATGRNPCTGSHCTLTNSGTLVALSTL
jgi:hypothetical protein